MRDGAALGRMLALGFDGDGVAAEDIQLAFRECLLVQLAAFSRWRNRIKNASVRDARLGVVRDELIAVGRDADPGETRLLLHGRPPRSPREPGNISRELTLVASVGYRAILIRYRSVHSHTISVSIAFWNCTGRLRGGISGWCPADSGRCDADWGYCEADSVGARQIPVGATGAI